MAVVFVSDRLDFLRRRWRVLAGAALAAIAIYFAVAASDKQGRGDVPSGYAVRMTCEPDPESYLWSGGCDRIAGDIARQDVPGIWELYRAFRTVHHTAIPSPAVVRQFGSEPCEPGFDLGKTLQGSRFVLSPDAFRGVCSSAHAQAVMGQIDARDRAWLTIERGGLSWPPLIAGAAANLTEPLVLFGATFAVLVLAVL
jgi:hypothetical protein